MLTTALLAERTATWPVTTRHAPRPAGRSLNDCFAIAPVRQLKAKEPLFMEGDAKSDVYKIEIGAVVMYKILSDGQRQVLGFAFPGDFIGLESASVHACDAETIGVTRVRCIPTAMLRRRANEDSTVAAELYEILSKAFSQSQSHFLTIGRLGANGRIATLLLALAKRNEHNSLDPNTIQLPMRRSDMADFLCLTVETVSRSLTELKKAKTISLSGFRHVKLLDRDALEDLACGEVA